MNNLKRSINFLFIIDIILIPIFVVIVVFHIIINLSGIKYVTINDNNKDTVLKMIKYNEISLKRRCRRNCITAIIKRLEIIYYI